MSGSPLKKYVLRPVLLSAAVYAVLTLPLAAFGTKQVTIKFQEEPVFHGQIKDIAPPYLGLASVISLGVGVASVAFTGWRQSNRKSSQVQAQLSKLAENLKEKEKQLEALKLSESRMAASGLNEFLDEEATQQSAKNSLDASHSTQPMVQPLAASQPIETQPAIAPQTTVQAVTKFTSAQRSLEYVPAKASVQPNYQVSEPPSASSELASSQVEELHAQLQQIMAQMASVQSALSATRSTVQ